MPNEVGSAREQKNQEFIKQDTLILVFNKLNIIDFTLPTFLELLKNQCNSRGTFRKKYNSEKVAGFFKLFM